MLSYDGISNCGEFHMKIRHSIVHYLPVVLGMLLIIRNIEQLTINLSLILEAIVLICTLIVHYTDCLVLSDKVVEGKRFIFSPKFEISTISVPRSKIRSCELKHFLIWNTIIIRGPYGATLVMHNMKNAKFFTDELKSRW